METIPVRGSSLTHLAYERLRDEVLSGALPPSQKLKIQQLAEQLGANQGAVREALSRLASEGLVTAEPQKGFRVCSISRAELVDLTRVRIDIEGMCMKRAIELGDLRWEAGLIAVCHELLKTPETAFGAGSRGPQMRMTESWSQIHSRFHEALVSSCDSPWLLRLRAQLFQQAERYRRLSVPLERTRRDTGAEHRSIMDAALAKDAKRACSLMAAHFNQTTEILLKALAFDETASSTKRLKTGTAPLLGATSAARSL